MYFLEMINKKYKTVNGLLSSKYYEPGFLAGAFWKTAAIFTEPGIIS